MTFESDGPGAVPSGFSTARTGRGAPGKWVVREEKDAPSGERVVAQISDSSTNYRLPLLVYDHWMASNVDVSVRFKPVSGRVSGNGPLIRHALSLWAIATRTLSRGAAWA